MLFPTGRDPKCSFRITRLPVAPSRLSTKTISWGWIDVDWQCAAAMLEAGVMDEGSEWITDKDVHPGIEAYRERFARQG